MRSIVMCVLAASLVACGGAEEQPKRPPPLVAVAPVALHPFADRYVAVGTATANEQVTLTAPVTERIVRLGFNDGQYVRKGQTIAVLAQGQEAAQLTGASARLRETQQQLARIDALKRRGFATNASLDTQVAAAATARADAAEARAAIGDRVVTAPFSGYASLRNISVGAVVSAGTEITRISDTSRIKLDFGVPETMLASLSVGQAISATAPAYPGSVFRGTVSAIDPQIDPATRAVRLRAILPNGDARLKPGMLLSVAVESRLRQSVAVPELALVSEGDARFVYMIGSDGKAKRQKVTTGGRLGNLVEIVEGLAPGARIVTEGVVKLSEGTKVRVQGQRGDRTGATK